MSHACHAHASWLPVACQSPTSLPPVAQSLASRAPSTCQPAATRSLLAHCSTDTHRLFVRAPPSRHADAQQPLSRRSPATLSAARPPRACRTPASRAPFSCRLPAACLAGCMSAALTRRSPAVCQLLAGPLPAAHLPLAGYLPLASRCLTSRCLTSRSSRCQPLACQQWPPSQISRRPGPALSKQPCAADQGWPPPRWQRGCLVRFQLGHPRRFLCRTHRCSWMYVVGYEVPVN